MLNGFQGVDLAHLATVKSSVQPIFLCALPGGGAKAFFVLFKSAFGRFSRTLVGEFTLQLEAVCIKSARGG